jgi:hypothetical protein
MKVTINVNANKCKVCSKSVYPVDAQLNLDGTKFHKACARCEDCQSSLTLANFVKIESELGCTLLCKTHYANRMRETGGTIPGDEKFKKGLKSPTPSPLTSPTGSVAPPSFNSPASSAYATVPQPVTAPQAAAIPPPVRSVPVKTAQVTPVSASATTPAAPVAKNFVVTKKTVMPNEVNNTKPANYKSSCKTSNSWIKNSEAEEVAHQESSLLAFDHDVELKSNADESIVYPPNPPNYPPDPPKDEIADSSLSSQPVYIDPEAVMASNNEVSKIFIP